MGDEIQHQPTGLPLWPELTGEGGGGRGGGWSPTTSLASQAPPATVSTRDTWKQSACDNAFNPYIILSVTINLVTQKRKLRHRKLE